MWVIGGGNDNQLRTRDHGKRSQCHVSLVPIGTFGHRFITAQDHVVRGMVMRTTVGRSNRIAGHVFFVQNAEDFQTNLTIGKLTVKLWGHQHLDFHSFVCPARPTACFVRPSSVQGRRSPGEKRTRGQVNPLGPLLFSGDWPRSWPRIKNHSPPRQQ